MSNELENVALDPVQPGERVVSTNDTTTHVAPALMPSDGEGKAMSEPCGETNGSVSNTPGGSCNHGGGVAAESPKQFLGGIEPYRPMPVEIMPPVIAQFVTEGSATLGCDPAFVALPLLSMMAAAIGNSRRIRLKPSWSEPSVLWTMIVADSGTQKTPAFDLALETVRKRQDQLMKEFAQAQSEYLDAQEQYEYDLKAWRKKEGPDRGDQPKAPAPLVLQRLWCSDTSIPALVVLLREAPRGLLLAQEESKGWLSSFSQGKKGQGGDVSHWLEMHGAGRLLVDRKPGVQTTIDVPRAAVSLTGGIQPAILRRCLTPQLFETGLVARLLVAMPPRQPKRWNDVDPAPTTSQKLADVHAKLLQLQPASDSLGDPYPADLTLTAEAKAVWIEYFNRHAQEQTGFGEGDLNAAWSKLEGYAARLALVMHCIRQVSGESVDPMVVDVDSMTAGIKLAEWFGHETERVYAALRETTEEQQRRELAELIQGLGGRASVRDLCQRRRKYRRDAALAEAHLQHLVDAKLGAWDSPPPGDQGGRPTKIFVLNLPAEVADEVDSSLSVSNTPTNDPASGGFVTVNAAEVVRIGLPEMVGI
jgi:hypothetical protein